MQNTSHLSIAEALYALPDSPDAIAEILKSRGFSGSRLDAASCPLAQYLDEVCDQSYQYEVSAQHGAKRIHPVTGLEDGPRVPLPPGCDAFVRKFDGGGYTVLDENSIFFVPLDEDDEDEEEICECCGRPY
jgi:hypothetical protein